MDEDRPGELVVVEVTWEQDSGNGWLFRQLLDLLPRDPDDLTDRDTPSVKQQGSER